MLVERVVDGEEERVLDVFGTEYDVPLEEADTLPEAA